MTCACGELWIIKKKSLYEKIKSVKRITIMTSLSSGVDTLLRAAQYLEFLEDQESGQQQLFPSIVLENPLPSTGT